MRVSNLGVELDEVSAVDVWANAAGPEDPLDVRLIILWRGQ